MPYSPYSSQLHALTITNLCCLPHAAMLSPTWPIGRAVGLHCEIDIQKVTQCVRAQRSGMIQMEAQYRFVYMAVWHYIQTTAQRMQAEQVGDRSATYWPLAQPTDADLRLTPCPFHISKLAPRSFQVTKQKAYRFCKNGNNLALTCSEIT